MSGTLYLIATPIGNLKDLTERAKETLNAVDLILAEDTRKSGLLLRHFEIKKPLNSFFEHNETSRIEKVLSDLKNGKSIALLTDAGTPTISDPGYKLVREAVSLGINVVGIPGASAVTLALSVSGLPTDKFLFLGFLPKKEGQKRNYFSELITRFSDFPVTLIAFESPYRLIETLEVLNGIKPETKIAVCRELTKMYEEVIRGIPKDLLNFYKDREPKGEITLVFHF